MNSTCLLAGQELASGRGTYHRPVWTAVALAAGIVVGLVAAVLWCRHGRRLRGRRGAETRSPVPNRLPAVVVDSLRSAAVALDSSDELVLVNGAAQAMGVVRGGRLASGELRRLVRAARRDGSPRQAEIELPGRGLDEEPAPAVARLIPVGGGDVVLLVEDVSEARRVDAVRRDFVANVSHELKTPVGAIALLAEAVGQARDEPAAVGRFADRLQHESQRLSRLVDELLDLSRLQGVGPAVRRPLPVDQVVTEAIDRTRLAAEAKDVSVAAMPRSSLSVCGDEAQLATVVANLLDNAIAYSAPAGRVSVGVRRIADTVEIAVADQGIGIARHDLDRIFERFYRVDQARSRATGGSGLGLAIVKHVVTNHAGSVRVWSRLGGGSTFTVVLPLAVSAAGERTA